MTVAGRIESIDGSFQNTQKERSGRYYSGFTEARTHGKDQLRRSGKRTPEVKQIYETVLRGKPGNVQKALAHRPEIPKNFLSFYSSVGRSLDRKLYEMIYLRVSLLNQCHY